MSAGLWEEAVGGLREATCTGEPSPMLLLNLAIAEDKAGHSRSGRGLMQDIAFKFPRWDEPELRLAESLRASGDLIGAEVAYRRALSLNPYRQEATVALSGILIMLARPDEAHDILRSYCNRVPNNAEAWHALGLAGRATGNTDLALTAFRNARELRRDSLDYILSSVESAIEAAQGESELMRLTAEASTNPLDPVVQVGRGVLLDRLGRQSDAIDALEIATDLAPNAMIPLKLLGSALARSGRVGQAEKILRRAWAMDPADVQINNDLATVLMRLHRHAEARDTLMNILEHHGQSAAILCNLANATACVGLQDEAVSIARRAISLYPNAILPRRTLCNTLPYQEGCSGADLQAAMVNCGAMLPRGVETRLSNEPDPDRPLLIGLLSGTLRSHPVGWLTVAGIENLDPDAFNTICLTQNVALDDVITRRYRAASRDWIDVGALSDAALSNVVRQNRIDILIDLGGYGDAGRMPACANRLAPVQIKWVGMQSHSSGLAEMDWFITDRWETPDGFEPIYSEKLLRLPDGYVCYSPPSNAPSVSPLPALTNGVITFGCFNNIAKITPLVTETWAHILRCIPGARLILKTHQLSDLSTRNALLCEFAMLGISGERLDLRGSSGHRAFMGEYGDVDIVLDPFPYSGGLTTCEALWMGVPTITLPGETFSSRHSASHMSNVGLADWVVQKIPDYVAMAISRSSDIEALSELRASMRARVRSSPLCDGPRFGRNLGAALRTAWQGWCETNRPA